MHFKVKLSTVRTCNLAGSPSTNTWGIVRGTPIDCFRGFTRNVQAIICRL